MGAGRKTTTYEYDHKSQQQYGAYHFESRQRNLGEALGGCIFGCTNDTMAECINDLVFGLPHSHWCYVQWIPKDSPIFLYNYITRELHGIFRAETDGTYELKPDGWCKSQGSKTPFPAQVKVSNYCECSPLSDREWKPILKECFTDGDKLLFELKRQEAQALCRAFDEKTNGRRSQNRPMPSATGADTQMAKEQKKPFRPASPPATPAWGAPASEPPARTASGQAAAKSHAPPQKPPDLSERDSFPALPGVKAAPPTAQARQSGDLGKADSNGADPQTKLRAMFGLTTERLAKKGSTQQESAGPVEKAQEKSKDLKEHQPSAAKGKLEKAKADPATSAQPAQPVQPAVQSTQPPQSNAPQANGPQGAAVAPPTTDPPQQAPASPRPRANQLALAARAPDTAKAPNGPAAAVKSQDEYTALVQRVQSSLKGTDLAAGDSLRQVLELVKEGLDQGARDRYSLAQVCDIFRKEKAELTNLVVQQANAIEILKEEAAALRRDLAFVGKHVNINVSVVNPYLEELQPLPELGQPASQQGTQQSAEAANHMLGISPTSEGLLMFGGNNSRTWVDNIDAFVPGKKQWSRVSAVPKLGGYWAATSSQSHVYLVGGGVSNSIASKACLRYDFPTDEWFQMEDMDTERGSLAAVSLDGKVYALGGGSPGVQLNSAEILDPNVNVWMKCKSLHYPRFATAAAALGSSIYVVGGFDGKAYLSTAERYDPREGKWQKLPDCTVRRGGHSLVAVDEEMWLMGGWDNTTFQDSVEVFDPAAGKWRKSARMKIPHAYFGAARLDGHVYAVSGMIERQKFTDIVEYYDPSIARWRAFYLESSHDDKHGRLRGFSGACKYEQ